jgi:hypothetical protein
VPASSRNRPTTTPSTAPVAATEPTPTPLVTDQSEGVWPEGLIGEVREWWSRIATEASGDNALIRLGNRFILCIGSNIRPETAERFTDLWRTMMGEEFKLIIIPRTYYFPGGSSERSTDTAGPEVVDHEEVPG